MTAQRRCGMVAGLLLATWLVADEPIMNMMPRWSGGWGFQFIEEYRHERDLLLGRTRKYPGFSEDVHIMHMQGVYTWDKSIRLSAKLPYVLDARREMPDGLGGKRLEHDHGIGDLTLALPLKRYFNLDGRSGSWSFKPLLRVPLSGDDDYEVYDKEWGEGLGLGYSTDTAKWYFNADTSAWLNHDNKPFETFSSLDFGRHIHTLGSNGTLIWENDFHTDDEGSRTWSAGPAFYWNVNDTIHFRLEWKHDFYDRQGVQDHGNGDTFKFSLGWVF